MLKTKRGGNRFFYSTKQNLQNATVETSDPDVSLAFKGFVQKIFGHLMVGEAAEDTSCGCIMII